MREDLDLYLGLLLVPRIPNVKTVKMPSYRALQLHIWYSHNIRNYCYCSYYYYRIIVGFKRPSEWGLWSYLIISFIFENLGNWPLAALYAWDDEGKRGWRRLVIDASIPGENLVCFCMWRGFVVCKRKVYEWCEENYVTNEYIAVIEK